MTIIEDGFLCFNTQRDFTQKTLLKFYEKLRLVLLINKKISKPHIIFTASSQILDSHYGNSDTIKHADAFYDEKNNVVMNAISFRSPSSKKFSKDTTSKEIFDDYTYTVPIIHIYHEVIHHIQFHLSPELYRITSFMEAVADIMTHILVGRESSRIYLKECVGLWYMCKQMMKMELHEFYWFIATAITTDDISKYLLHKKDIIKDAAKYHGGGVRSLMHNIRDYGAAEDADAFWRDILKLHNIIFKNQ